MTARDSVRPLLRTRQIREFTDEPVSDEMLAALNAPDQWRLAIVMVDGNAGTPAYVAHPFTREPQFGETCAAFDLKSLLIFQEAER